jgi:glycosyltransferase involved in cell wall biosynthesis
MPKEGTTMSVSVVIPAYNASRFIAETLQSVLAQTLLPDEILVVDDGSSDDTAAIAEAFGAPVRVFRRTNQRQAAARNFGVEQATGDWIAFLDADDLWAPNKLAMQFDELARHPEADICYTGRVLLLQRGDTATLGGVISVPPAAEIRRALFVDATFLPSSVVIRRSTILGVNGFDPRIQYGNEDYDLWLRLLHAGVVFAACCQPLVSYRRHETNTALHEAWLDECMDIYLRLVVPHLPGFKRPMALNRFRSTHECDLAFTLREKGDRTCLLIMAKSILHYPFNDPNRYKVLAHMFFTRIKQALG